MTAMVTKLFGKEDGIMKKIIFAFGIVLASVTAMVSCQKDIEVSKAGGTSAVTLSVEVASKINSSGTTMRWNSSAESMAVIGRVGSQTVIYKFSKGSEAAASSATFSCDVVDNAAELLYAVFPYSEDYTIANDGKLNLTISATGQNLTAMNSVPNNTLMVGKVSGSTASLKSVCAYLKINLPERSNSGLSEVSLIKVHGTGIAGDIVVDMSGDAPVSVGAGTENYITVKPKMTGTQGRTGVVFVPVLPGTYNDFAIEMIYGDGSDRYTRTSSSSNNYLRNKVYDCGTMSGPYVKALAAAVSKEGTTLTLTGTGQFFKYSGVTNANYTATFLYKAADDPDLEENWIDVQATITGDDENVEISASDVVDAGTEYVAKLVVAAGGLSTTVNATSGGGGVTPKETASVTLTTATATDFANFVYSPAPADGYHKAVDADGNDIFPPIYPGKKSGQSYNAKIWYESTSSYGDKVNISLSDDAATNIVGGTLTKGIYQFVFSSTETYYSIFSKKFCCNRDYTILLPCPSGYAITSVVLYVSKNNNVTWGLGTTSNEANIAPKQGAKDANNPVTVTLTVSNPVEDTQYYLISGAANNRFETLTVNYEYDAE